MSPKPKRRGSRGSRGPIDEEIFDGLGLRLWPAYLHEDLVKDVRPALMAMIGGAGGIASRVAHPCRFHRCTADDVMKQ